MCSQSKDMKIISTEVIENVKIANGIFKMSFNSSDIAGHIYPGQFVNVKIPNDNALILRRPFSVFDVNNNTVSIIYLVVGKGTQALSKINAGQEIDVLGPLGKGFDIDVNKDNVILVGGGCGTPPLHYLAKKLKTKAKNIISFMGFSSRDKVILDVEMTKIAEQVLISTDDKSHNIGELCTYSGNIIELLKTYYTENKDKINKDNAYIFACGPNALLSSLKKFCNDYGFQAQVSMEERMGCGFGVCLGCAVKSTDNDFKYVCKDGPVFDIQEVNI